MGFISKPLQNCDKPYFQDEEYQKNNKPHIFTPPRPLGSGGVKIWGLLFFFKKYKIGNNDFITILGSENPNSMMFTTNYCSKPTVNVPVGSVTHIESPWTLDITPISLTVGGDLIFWLKNRFITILVCFISESHREVAPLGLEFIGLWFICTKYINFLMRHTHHMHPSYPAYYHTYIVSLIDPR